MRKKLLIAMSAIAMLFATSCQDDLGIDTGNEALVSFNVTTPEMVTRAFGDGYTAKELQYAVYDIYQKDGEEVVTYLENLQPDEWPLFEDGRLTTTIELKLVKGNSYKVIFWAAAEDAPYEVNFAEKTMTVDYTNAKSNAENRDAFYGREAFTVAGTQTVDVTLTRPFAQLNVGTNDYELARNANINPTVSKVVVDAYATMNLWNGSVVEENPIARTFDYGDIPTEDFPVSGYDYIAMNYLLVGEKEPVNVVFTCQDVASGREFTRKVGSVPVQRNYRTNIYGSILTSDVDVDVEIKPGFGGDIEENNLMVYNAFELQAALDAAPENAETTIYLAQDIEGDVTDIQKAGRKVVIEGGGNKYEGSIKVHANSYYYSDAALTIKNVKFETSTASENFIEALENGSERYSNNITVEGCTFTATGEAVNTAVGVQVKATRGVTVENCTATNRHSLIQAQSCDTGDVKVINSTVNGKNGVAFKQVKSAVVKDTEITAVGYGIRFDGNTDNYAISIEGNEVSAPQPFIVRRMTGANNSITLQGENTLTVLPTRAATEAPAYQIVITNGEDDKEYVKPTGTYILTGADDFFVYPRDYALPVASWDEFTAALAAGEEKIMFTENIAYEGGSSYNLKKDVVVELNGKTFTTGNASTTWLNIMGSKATFKNGIIEGKVYFQKNGATYSNATFENVTFGGTITFSSVTQGSLAVQGGNSVYAKKCTFKGKGSTQPNVVSLEGTSSGSVIFEDCTFNSSMNRFYANPIGGTAVFKLINCSFNKAAVVETAATLDLNNLVIDGSKKQNVNLYIAKAKDSLTEEEKTLLNYIKTKTSGTVYCAGVKY